MWFELLEVAWGHKLGKLVKVKSWRPGFEKPCRDWREWGIGWPTLLVDDRPWGRTTTTPIWNFVWLANRFKEAKQWLTCRIVGGLF